MIAPPKRPAIYVASRASVPARVDMWKRARADGFPIISTWIDEAGPGQTPDFGELWQRVEREIHTATGLVLYVAPEDLPLKGALVEVGMALAVGVHVFVVAPGLTIDDRTHRPIGSWMSLPRVKRCRSLREALINAASPP